jgi:DNA-binding CsgD family transcriptional regulator/PAS domain-containing protein
VAIDIDPQDLSDVIGKIYDSAVDPALWPDALESMCGLIGATLGYIGTFDTHEKSMRWTPRWGGDPYWMQLLHDKYAAQMPFWSIMPEYQIGETANTRTMVERLRGDEQEIRNGPFFKEWAEPAGYLDVAATVVMRNGNRIASFNLHTPPTRELIGPRDLAIIGLLVPHVRRAVTVGDILDMRSIVSAAFEATLNALAAAVVLVDTDGSILHSNDSAQAMFSAGGPIQSQRGLLSTHDASATAALKDAIARAATNESELGYGGIGVPVRNRSGEPSFTHSIAHVLPLKSGTLRPGLSLGAVAAVFVTPVLENPPPPFEALAALYDLTPTEARVMVEVASGKNRAATAIALGIADSTVKTHLARVFEKTHTSEQGELAKLVASLTPPIVARPKD